MLRAASTTLAPCLARIRAKEALVPLPAPTMSAVLDHGEPPVTLSRSVGTRLACSPGLRLAHYLTSNQQMNQSCGDIGIEDHHAHRRRRSDIACVIHIQHRD